MASQRLLIQKYKRTGEKGFSLTESLIALMVGTMIIAAAGFAMRSTQSLIKGSGEKANQRQNITNGLRLLRSEVERSLYLMFNGPLPNDEMANTDLSQLDDGNQHLLQYCRILAAGKNGNLSLHPDLPQGGSKQQSIDGQTTSVSYDAHPSMVEESSLDPDGNPINLTDPKGRDLHSKFIPVFALPMDDVDLPVVYGLTTRGNNRTFTLSRCGTPLRMDGTYDEAKPPFISTVLDGIGMVPCTKHEQNAEGKCLSEIPDSSSASGFKAASAVTAEDMLDLLYQQSDYGYDIQSADNRSPSRHFLEPAFRIETDSFRKLVRFTSPMDCTGGNTDCPTDSFTEILSASRSLSNQPLLMTAFARADKNIAAGQKKQASVSSNWFRNVSSKRVRFLVDGSGSMGACMVWSKDAEGRKVRGDTYRDFYSPEYGQYIRTRNICLETRMERLQDQLNIVVDGLPDDAKIAIESFSTPGSSSNNKNKKWADSASGLVELGGVNSSTRQSARSFINSLNDGSPTQWGGTKPWQGLKNAFNDDQADTLYFLSDGRPTYSLYVGNGEYARSSNSYVPAGQYFADMNNQRTIKLKVNSTAVELSSTWMQDLSDRTGGNYIQSQ